MDVDTAAPKVKGARTLCELCPAQAWAAAESDACASCAPGRVGDANSVASAATWCAACAAGRFTNVPLAFEDAVLTLSSVAYGMKKNYACGQATRIDHLVEIFPT